MNSYKQSKSFSLTGFVMLVPISGALLNGFFQYVNPFTLILSSYCVPYILLIFRGELSNMVAIVTCAFGTLN